MFWVIRRAAPPRTGTTVYADQDDDGNFDETTLAALGTLEAGTKSDVPVLLWNDADSGKDIDSGELKQPSSDDVKGYKVFADWKVGDVDTDPELKYVKFQKEDGLTVTAMPLWCISLKPPRPRTLTWLAP